LHIAVVPFFGGRQFVLVDTFVNDLYFSLDVAKEVKAKDEKAQPKGEKKGQQQHWPTEFGVLQQIEQTQRNRA